MLLIETNLPDSASAERIAGDFLAARLVGCVNWWPIRSRYWWKGKIVTDEEVRLVLKTTPGRRSAALKRLIKHHPYDIPWISHHETQSDQPR